MTTNAGTPKNKDNLTLIQFFQRRMRHIFSFTAILILLAGTLGTWFYIRNSEIRRSQTIFQQVDGVLTENSASLAKEEKLYYNTSLANARMVAFILQEHPEIRENPEELKKICTMLEIDEIHIFDENGVIVQGTQPEYYGYSFDSGEQMSFFKPLLTNKSLELVQDLTPNTAAGKLEQYSALWSEDRTFIVEVGNHPQRILDALEKNELPYIFHLVGAGSESTLYSIDLESETITASTKEDLDADTPLESINMVPEQMESGRRGFFTTIDGVYSFCVSEVTDDYCLVRTVPASSLYSNMLLIELIMILAVMIIFALLNRSVIRAVSDKVIDPLQNINLSLNRITEGAYDTRIEKQQTREFSELADYMNTMTASIEEHVNSIHYQSRHDILTDVWNRNALQLKLGKLRVQEKTAAVLYADLNSLKKINDERGHDAGDQAIISLADALTSVFGRSVVYRAGGDEFVVLDEDLTRSDLDSKFLDLQDVLSEKEISASAGTAFCADTRQIDQSMIEADVAMYTCKRAFHEAHPEAGSRLQISDMTDSSQLAIRYTSPSPMTAALGTDTRRSAPEKPVWMRYLEELFQIFSNLSEGAYVYICDLDYDYSIWSEDAVELFGLPDTHMEHAAELWENRIHPDDREDYHTSIEKIFRGEVNFHDMQYRAMELNGRYDVCTCRGFIINDENGNPRYFGGTIRNTSLEGKVDSLTGLINRDGFFESLNAHIRNREKAVFTMFGLSEFSEVNSLYGYEFGNKVLRKIARHARSIFANLGDYYLLDGTQTILVSHNVPYPMLEKKYNELKNWLLEDFELDGYRIPIRLNGATVRLDQFDVDANTVFVCLNTAYQYAKRETQGDLVYYNNEKSDTRDALRKANAVRLSLSKGYEGFEMFYQPIVDAASEKLTGAEALLRWSSKELGYLPPDRFIPVLENDSRFYALGLWIIRRSLMDGRRIVEKNPDFLLHVNLSYTQIQNATFEQDILQLLQITGYPARNFCLEITERCRLADPKRLQSFIIRLKSFGVRFALDDFGTGYASTTALRDLDIDIVKVDKTFIQKIETDEQEQRCLKNIVDLANIYGAETCIEGIETASMRRYVLEAPVNFLQGYYYSKPIPATEFYSRYGI